MGEKVKKVSVTTLRDLIEVERERLKKLRIDKPQWWTSSGDWARREFGENLDGEINDHTLRCQMETCQICSKNMVLDEKFLRLEFSFCDEYDCEMNICKSCLRELAKKL